MWSFLAAFIDSTPPNLYLEEVLLWCRWTTVGQNMMLAEVVSSRRWPGMAWDHIKNKQECKTSFRMRLSWKQGRRGRRWAVTCTSVGLHDILFATPPSVKGCIFREGGDVINVPCNTVFCSAVFYRCVIQMVSAKDVKLKVYSSKFVSTLFFKICQNVRLYRVVYTHLHCGSPVISCRVANF